jgi:hypothetical protein
MRVPIVCSETRCRTASWGCAPLSGTGETVKAGDYWFGYGRFPDKYGSKDEQRMTQLTVHRQYPELDENRSQSSTFLGGFPRWAIIRSPSLYAL